MKKNDLAEEAIQTNNILLPGGNKQLEHLFEQKSPQGTRALIIGPGCENVAIKLGENFSNINIIANDYDSVMQIRMKLKDEDKVKVKLMDYAHTDFDKDYFDLIYAQGSISVPDKKDIVKEIKRILSSKGLFCAGEIVSLKEPVPGFVADIWERSGIEPITSSEIKKYYEGKGFEVLSEKDFSDTLHDFYDQLRTTVSKVSKDEKEADKKYFSRMKHESHAYLKLGGDKYIGFKSLIMRKLN
ncbi:MAG: methyltransferase domain-containing protein [Ignavibacteriaceae bacterium]|nr:methyltransferase domain-containing protein [Ignavibacteriaceae bacterium]